MLENGADKYHQSNPGKTPLHSAAFPGHLEAVKMLATRGGRQLLLRDEEGRTTKDLAETICLNPRVFNDMKDEGDAQGLRQETRLRGQYTGICVKWRGF